MSLANGSRSPLQWTIAAFVSVAGLLLATAGGCDVITSVGPKSCDQSTKGNPPTTYSDGTVENGIFMTSPWDKDLLYFPGGIQIRIEHHLGAKPREWAAYLAFDENGVSTGPLASAAGNQVVLVGLDDQAITVKNGSCADYFLLVTAQVDADGVPPPSSTSASP